MIRIVITLCTILLLTGCEDDDVRYNNPNLTDINFQAEVNLNLAQFSSLKFTGNRAVLTGFGLQGIVIYNLNGTQFNAFELSDPNHPPNSCSRMTLDGIEALCPCGNDDNAYTIISGQPVRGDGEFGMKPYRVERVGDVLIISN